MLKEKNNICSFEKIKEISYAKAKKVIYRGIFYLKKYFLNCYMGKVERKSKCIFQYSFAGFNFTSWGIHMCTYRIDF